MHELKTIPKTALDEWIGRLRAKYRVVGPQKREGHYTFDEIHTAADLALDYTTTGIPPKKYLFPPRETLLRYHIDGSHVEAVIESEPTVIFGLHTCDLKAIDLFDQIFSQGFTDKHYRNRRENTLLISLECFSPCSEHAYCRDMGTWHLPDLADLHLTEFDDFFLIHVNTDKGAALLAGLDASTASNAQISEYEIAMDAKAKQFPKRLNFEADELDDVLRESYNNPIWQQVGDDCLVCGMCTQVCPTCVCFDVADEASLDQKTGQRVRRWDSCQAMTFALVAGGHNFREARMARQRHRFMRKGKYMQDAYGMLGCVGCGRCGEACLVHITPINVFNKLHADKQAEEVAQ